MITLQLILTLIVFAPIWWASEHVVRPSGAYTHLAALFGLLYLARVVAGELLSF